MKHFIIWEVTIIFIYKIFLYFIKNWVQVHTEQEWIAYWLFTKQRTCGPSL